MIEYFVISFAKELINFKEFDKNRLKASFNKYIKPKKEEYEEIIKEIKELKEVNIAILSHIANSLILKLLK